MIQFKIKGIKFADISTGKEKQKCSNTLKAAELCTHTTKTLPGIFVVY